jgi:hypothetical protein
MSRNFATEAAADLGAGLEVRGSSAELRVVVAAAVAAAAATL